MYHTEFRRGYKKGETANHESLGCLRKLIVRVWLVCESVLVAALLPIILLLLRCWMNIYGDIWGELHWEKIVHDITCVYWWNFIQTAQSPWKDILLLYWFLDRERLSSALLMFWGYFLVSHLCLHCEVRYTHLDSYLMLQSLVVSKPKFLHWIKDFVKMTTTKINPETTYMYH